jgi:anti-anti-sigma factor
VEGDPELKIRICPEEGARIIELEGDLSISTAALLRTTLLEGMQTGAKAMLDMAGVRSLDLSGMQLLCSAHRSYAQRNAVLQVRRVNDDFRRIAMTAGYDARQSVCPFRKEDNCLWRLSGNRNEHE